MRSAFRSFYGEHVDFVCRSIEGLGLHGPQVEDVAQDVFVTVCRRGPLPAPDVARGWLYGVTRNAVLHARRAEARRRRKHDALQQRGPERVSADPTSTLDAGRELARFLDQLSEEQRAVFVGHELVGLSAPELGAALGVAINTVYSRLRLARRKLARHNDHGRRQRIWAALALRLPSLPSLAKAAACVAMFTVAAAPPTSTATPDRAGGDPPASARTRDGSGPRTQVETASTTPVHDGLHARAGGDLDTPSLFDADPRGEPADRSADARAANPGQRTTPPRTAASETADTKRAERSAGRDARGPKPARESRARAAQPDATPNMLTQPARPATDPSLARPDALVGPPVSADRAVALSGRGTPPRPGTRPPPPTVRPKPGPPPRPDPAPTNSADRPAPRAPVTATRGGFTASVPLGRIVAWTRGRRSR